MLFGFGVVAGLFALSPAWAQSSSGSGSTNWGWYTPPPPKKPAAPKAGAASQAAQAPAQPTTTTMQGGDTSGNQAPITTTSTSTSGPEGETQTQQISIPGINGGQRTLVDQTTHTIRVNADTTRTITDIYGQDSNGNRELIGVRQTDTTDLGDGKSQSVTKEKHLDINGNMALTRQVESETVPTGANTSTTNVTVLTPTGDGQMSTAQKIVEVEKKEKDGKQTTNTLMLPDGNGGWTTTQKTETVVQKQPDGRQTEDKKTYSINANGNLAVSQRVVTDSWKDKKTGQEHQQVSTYATTPGGTMGPNGVGLSLMQRVSTVKTVQPNGTIQTQQTYEQPSPVSMSKGLKITGQVIEVATPTKSGKLATQRTVYTDNGNGQLQQISAFSGEAPMPETAPKHKPDKKAASSANEKKPAAKAANPKSAAASSAAAKQQP